MSSVAPGTPPSDQNSSPRNQRSGRSARGRKDRSGRAAAVAPAYITRKIPYYDLLSEDALCALEDQADWLLQEVGVEFRENPGALERWRQAGATVTGSRVQLPKGLARQLCKTAPRQFTQLARNPAKSVTIGGDHTVFAPVYGSPFTHCLDKGRRYGSLEDFSNLVKIAARLPQLHHQGFVICEPCDIPVNKRHLDMLMAHIRHGDKPFLGAITEKERAEDSVAMARILHGDDTLSSNCTIMGNVNTNSPLLVDKVASDAIDVYCGANQGIVVVPFILSGAMGPVTTAASVAQALAEAMICCAYSQLVAPGAPFVLGNFLSSMSLKSGAPTFGMPEPVLSNYAIGQLARRLGVPLRCGGSLTASKLPDAQAAYESADSMHSTVLGGANFILHAAGWMEGGLATSFEKLVMDADRLGAYAVMLGGMATDENALARDAYSEVEPAGHFLGCSHTMRNYETAFFESTASDSESFEQWQEKGSLDAAQRANARWKELLVAEESPSLDPAVEEELDAFVSKRKESMADAWY
ncbi:trimethylamine methyltransferase family protein [Rhodovibrionaceae bacterium A322]